MADFNVTELESGIDFDSLEYWDVVIVGAGPAGLAASLTTAHRGLTTLVIEAKGLPGGLPQFLYPDKQIVDIPGFPDGISGEELSARVYRQARNALVQFRFGEELLDILDTAETGKEDSLKKVVTNGGEYKCRKVIIAFGLLHFPRRLAVLDQLDSRKVHYRVPKIGDYERQDVAIVGAGDSALDAAVMVLGRHGTVQLIVRGQQPAGKMSTFRQVRDCGGLVHMSTQISTAAFAGGRIELTLTDGQVILVDMVIVQIGFLSAKDTFKRLNVRLSDDGSIAIDPYYETSRKGIFAVGDVHGDIKLIAVAWADLPIAFSKPIYFLTSWLGPRSGILWRRYLQNNRLVQVRRASWTVPEAESGVRRQRTRHKWTLARRFRRHAFGWRSQPDDARVRESRKPCPRFRRRPSRQGPVMRPGEC